MAGNHALDPSLRSGAPALAYRVASPHETGAAVAALARELGATMTKALAGVTPAAADPLDEIRARRDRKRWAPA